MNDIYVTAEYPNPPIRYIPIHQPCDIRVEEYTTPSIKEKIKAYINSIYNTKCLKRKETPEIMGLKVKLKSVELVEENNRFYLDATYLYETRGCVSEIHIPRIDTKFMRSDNLCMHQVTDATGCKAEVDIDVGGGMLFLSSTKGPNGDDVFYYQQVLEKEMTVEEIEKALGHPVKIVGEECTDNVKIK